MSFSAKVLQYIIGFNICPEVEDESRHSRAKHVEAGLSGHSDQLTTLETRLDDVAAANKSLQLQVEDFISRSKRKNIHVIELPVDSETGYPTQFMAELFKEVLGDEAFPNLPELDRAHRSLAPKPRPGGRPRPIIVRFHRYKEKELVLQWAREHGDITFPGHNIKFYQDFSSSLVKKRAAFNDIKSTLYKKGIRFGLIHPARLHVTFNGEVKFSENPEEAESFYRQRIH
uniref:L1 transposable element RRM domain-containing protein n=1 Tax=Salmo trutta TaxID=8032 RepID=A0A673WYK5_SALTR